ncbi:MAG: hypothetical protein ACFCD0_10465 [Gemmataceae bacterium]
MIQYSCPNCSNQIRRPTHQNQIHCASCGTTFSSSRLETPYYGLRKVPLTNRYPWLLPAILGAGVLTVLCGAFLFVWLLSVQPPRNNAPQNVWQQVAPGNLAPENGDPVGQRGGKNKTKALVMAALNEPNKGQHILLPFNNQPENNGDAKAKDDENPTDLKRKQEPPEAIRTRNIVARFILADIGRIRGAEAANVHLQFNALGVESIPFMVEGVNTAAEMRASCPIIALQGRLTGLISQCDDAYMLEQAQQNLGQGVRSGQWSRQVQNLRQACKTRLSKLNSPNSFFDK